jgi:hypothetical protein
MHCLPTVGWGAGSTAQSDTPNPSSRRPLRTSFERTATHGSGSRTRRRAVASPLSATTRASRPTDAPGGTVRTLSQPGRKRECSNRREAALPPPAPPVRPTQAARRRRPDDRIQATGAVPPRAVVARLPPRIERSGQHLAMAQRPARAPALTLRPAPGGSAGPCRLAEEGCAQRTLRRSRRGDQTCLGTYRSGGPRPRSSLGSDMPWRSPTPRRSRC